MGIEKGINSWQLHDVKGVYSALAGEQAYPDISNLEEIAKQKETGELVLKRSTNGDRSLDPIQLIGNLANISLEAKSPELVSKNIRIVLGLGAAAISQLAEYKFLPRRLGSHLVEINEKVIGELLNKVGDISRSSEVARATKILES